MAFIKKENVSDEHIQNMLAIFDKINTKSVWSKVKNAEDFTVKRFAEGFVNDICACILTEEAISRLSPNKEDPLSVVVKIFPKNPIMPSDPVQQSLIHSTICNAGFGPKLIYMDTECCVNELLANGRDQLYEDDLDDELTAKIFRSLAGYHHLNVPISTGVKHFVEGLKHFRDKFDGAKEVCNGKLFDFLAKDEQFSSYAERLEKIKFSNMFEYFPQASLQIGSPIVFSHTDFHRSNRIITTKTLPNGKVVKDFYFIDYETSMYAYRGMDIGSFWRSYLQEEWLSLKEIASDEKMLRLIEIYRQECAKICGEEYLTEDVNSAENILREAKFFLMYYFCMYHFFAAAMYCQNPTKEKNREFLQMVYNTQPLVAGLLKQYKDDGTLPDIGIDIY